MRVLLTVHRFVPEFSAGTEILTLDTARDLKARGHQVAVFTGIQSHAPLADAARFDRYEYDGIPVERFHYDRVPMGVQENVVEAEYDNRFLARRFRSVLEEFRPEVVHFFHLQKLSSSPIEECRNLGIPTVMTPTDFWLVCPFCQLRFPDDEACPGPRPDGVNCLRHVVRQVQPGPVDALLSGLPDGVVASLIRLSRMKALSKYRLPSYVQALADRPRVLRERMNHLDCMLVPSRLMEQTLLRWGLDSHRVVRSRFGINLSHVRRSPRPNDPGMLAVGFIGTIHHHKGLHVLIRALRSLPDEGVKLSIYGDADEYARYGAAVRALAAGDPRIEFRGRFPNSRIGEVMGSLDVLVVPSVWHENTPLVVYSAQAAGCPIIASDVEGLSEVVHHERNGLLFPVSDSRALAATLRRIARDRRLLMELAANAPSPKSIPEYVSELLEIYRRLASERAESGLRGMLTPHGEAGE